MRQRLLMLMSPHETLRLLTARLSRRIVFWVFGSLVVIEAVLLVPSVYRREQELLMQLREISAARVSAIAQLSNKAQNHSLQTDSLMQLHRLIVGGAIYSPDGRLMKRFGEPPQLTLAQVKAHQTQLRSPKGDRYDVAWTVPSETGDCVLIIRHDSSQIQGELIAYVARITGLVVIISIVVTLSTMIALCPTVIIPILHLRRDLLEAGEAASRDRPRPELTSTRLKTQDELGEVILAFEQMLYQIDQAIAERKQAEKDLRLEKEKSEQLLLNILPQAIAEQLKQEHNLIAQRFDHVTILFADLVDFTGLAGHLSPIDLVTLLNEIFSAFDRLVEQYGLEKIKTIGDAYMVAGGLPMPHPDAADAIAALALEMQAEIQRFLCPNGRPYQLRIGINTGPVVAGVIGIKKFIYDLWGDAVNVASRMESHGIPGQIQVSEATYHYLKDCYLLEQQAPTLIKGKGVMTTYLLRGRKPDTN